MLGPEGDVRVAADYGPGDCALTNLNAASPETCWQARLWRWAKLLSRGEPGWRTSEPCRRNGILITAPAHTVSTPHQPATNRARISVTLFSESSSTRSLKPWMFSALA